MKRITKSILSICLGLSLHTNAQFNFFEPIKSPVNYPQTVLEQLYIGHPNVVTQDPDGASWVNREKISYPKNTQGDITKFANYQWNTANSSWDPAQMQVDFTYSYDGSNKMTGYTRILSQVGTVLMERNTTSISYNNNKIEAVHYNDLIQGQTLAGRDTFIYNGNGLLTEKVSSYIILGFENLMTRILYAYAGTNVIEELTQDQSGGNWIDNERSTFTYDTDNRMSSMLKETYDENTTSWTNEESNVYNYDANGRVSIHEKYDMWNGASYDDGTKGFYTYDGTGKLIALEEQKFISNNWVNETNSDITYTGTMPFEAYSYLWTGTAYATVASEKVIWTDPNPGSNVPAAPTNLALEPLRAEQTIRLTWTDNANDETGFIVERSTDGTNFTQVADIASANTQTYDDAGLPESTTYYYRVMAYNSTGNSSSSNVAQATTGASSTSGIEENGSINISFYPNPASTEITINAVDETDFKIYSLMGQVVKAGTISTKNEKINISEILAGNYFISFSVNGQTSVKKISIK
jgi:hypothetical protein